MMDKVKQYWMSLAFVFGLLPSVYSAYIFVQPDFAHLEEHIEVSALMDATGNIVAIITTDHLPEVSTTVQILVDDEHIQHLHFPQGIPVEKGKSYAVGTDELVMNAHISYFPTMGDVEVRFIFDGFPMLMAYVVSAHTKLLYDDGES